MNIKGQGGVLFPYIFHLFGWKGINLRFNLKEEKVL